MRLLVQVASGCGREVAALPHSERAYVPRTGAGRSGAFDTAALPQRWCAIVTYGFVHVDWNHIIVNMPILVWVWVERLIGPRRFVVLVVAAILTGGSTLLARQTAGIGFSTAAAAILFDYRVAFPWKRELPLGVIGLGLFHRDHRPLPDDPDDPDDPDEGDVT